MILQVLLQIASQVLREYLLGVAMGQMVMALTY